MLNIDCRSYLGGDQKAYPGLRVNLVYIILLSTAVSVRDDTGLIVWSNFGVYFHGKNVIWIEKLFCLII